MPIDRRVHRAREAAGLRDLDLGAGSAPSRRPVPVEAAEYGRPRCDPGRAYRDLYPVAQTLQHGHHGVARTWGSERPFCTLS